MANTNLCFENSSRSYIFIQNWTIILRMQGLGIQSNVLYAQSYFIDPGYILQCYKKLTGKFACPL